MSSKCASRRDFIRISTGATVAAGMGLGLVSVACGDDDGATTDASMSPDAQAPDAAPADAAPADAAPADASTDAQSSPGVFAAALADVSAGDVIFVTAAEAFLLRDAGGLYALTAVCTHLGCTVNDATGQFTCPCHGSEFDYDGAVLLGPAADALAQLQVTVDGSDDVYIDPDVVVAAGTRVAV